MKLDELATTSGIAARTVRYYVQRGLLPAPAFRGKDTAYGPEHLTRLRAIKRLQEQHLPLDVIQRQLDGSTLSEIEDIASGASLAAPVADAPPSVTSALPSRWVRYVVAPGVELQLDTNAPASSQRLVERLLSQIEKESS